MSEIIVAEAPGRHVRAPSRRVKLFASIAAVSALALSGAGVAIAESQHSDTPNVINFDRYESSCVDQTRCLSRAAVTLHHAILGPSEAIHIQSLVADGSPLNPDGTEQTDENILTYRMTAPSGATVSLMARAGHDSALKHLDAPASVISSGQQVTIAGQTGYIGQSATGGYGLWIVLDNMRYQFSSTSATVNDLQAVAAALRAVD